MRKHKVDRRDAAELAMWLLNQIKRRDQGEQHIPLDLICWTVDERLEAWGYPENDPRRSHIAAIKADTDNSARFLGL